MLDIFTFTAWLPLELSLLMRFVIWCPRLRVARLLVLVSLLCVGVVCHARRPEDDDDLYQHTSADQGSGAAPTGEDSCLEKGNM